MHFLKAEEITLTIGQAFELAYQKFMEKNNHNFDMKKQLLLAQKKIQNLTQENLHLKARVADLERIINPSVLEEFDKSKSNVSHKYDTILSLSFFFLFLPYNLFIYFD